MLFRKAGNRLKWNGFVTLSILTAFLLIQCAQVPVVRVWRPWIRILEAEPQIDLKGTFSIEVQGETEPLLGSETILQSELRDQIAWLLERRGFEVVTLDGDYELLMHYQTTRNEKNHTSIRSEQISASVGVAGREVDVNAALGIAIARMIAGMATATQQTSEVNQGVIIDYTHNIALEIVDRTDNLIWKGESTWESRDLGAESDFGPSLQLLLSSLPSDTEYYPRIKRIKKTSVEEFYETQCANSWFSSPALPYRTKFVIENVTARGHTVYNPLPRSVVEPTTLVAYIDLLQTAEYALPLDATRSTLPNPLDKKIWRKVQLGGMYYLGDDENASPILIELHGSPAGYQEVNPGLRNLRNGRTLQEICNGGRSIWPGSMTFMSRPYI